MTLKKFSYHNLNVNAARGLLILACEHAHAHNIYLLYTFNFILIIYYTDTAVCAAQNVGALLFRE